MPSGRCGDGSDEPGWPAAENHQVGFIAFSVGPIRRMALLDSLLVVNQEIGFGGAETRQVTDRFIPEIPASQLQADRVSDKRSSNKYKFRAQLEDISALQPKPPRKDTKS